MSVSEMRSMAVDKLEQKLSDAYKTVTEFKSQTENTVSQKDYRTAKKQIAQIKTLIKEAEQGENDG